MKGFTTTLLLFLAVYALPGFACNLIDIKSKGELRHLGVPYAFVALEKWPGQVIAVGPISDMQARRVAFRPDNPELLSAFNAFYETLLQDGS